MFGEHQNKSINFTALFFSFDASALLLFRLGLENPEETVAVGKLSIPMKAGAVATLRHS